ncbi:MAG: hypothetical protein WKG07_02390 [Hymenobacter sp.]
MQASALLQLNTHPVMALTAPQSAFLSELFRQMLTETDSTYRYKYDLLRTCVQLILHEAQRLRPDLQHDPGPSASTAWRRSSCGCWSSSFPCSRPTGPAAAHCRGAGRAPGRARQLPEPGAAPSDRPHHQRPPGRARGAKPRPCCATPTGPSPTLPIA